ncbi:MAG: type II toxin-antitoxin system RelE/ParE family toxin [Ruminococcus sp.]|nr:type II toxin-antitoxin system RelE/ParE family toxin [Ruminococcus sp.]
MKSKIVFSPKSLKDLDDIYTYISEELQNPIAANNTINKILDSVDLLQEQPESGKMLTFLSGMNSGYRFVIAGNYIVFYRHIDNIVYVDRVIYGRRDYMKILFPDI